MSAPTAISIQRIIENIEALEQSSDNVFKKLRNSLYTPYSIDSALDDRDSLLYQLNEIESLINAQKLNTLPLPVSQSFKHLIHHVGQGIMNNNDIGGNNNSGGGDLEFIKDEVKANDQWINRVININNKNGAQSFANEMMIAIKQSGNIQQQIYGNERGANQSILMNQRQLNTNSNK